jgi:hypothetical protein
MTTKIHKLKSGIATAACLLAGLGLAPQTNAQTGGNASEQSGAPPHIVSTSPKVGATDVDPATKVITVTFDRDMEAGMSWTGGGPNFPKSPEGAEAHWTSNKRTCVLPVKLEPGHYYRVGINAPSYLSFRGLNGRPVAPSAITFRTTGTAIAPKVPKIVSLEPANGARDVSPSVTELRVTFSVPMAKGFSWTGGGPNFPTIPEGKKPYWTEGGKACVLPVELKPGSTYELGLNSLRFKGFQSEDSVPLEPVVYTFRTSGSL